MKQVATYFLIIAFAACLAPAWADTARKQAHELSVQGLAASKAGNFAEAAKDFAAALDVRPHHPGIIYNLAASLAKAGRLQDAIANLDAYADMGLVADVEADHDFDALKEQPGFKAVLAKFKANSAPIGTAQVLATVGGAPFLAEGLALDPATKRIFVSSVDQRSIVAISPAGAQTGFADRATGLLGAFGMVVDTKRQLLLVSASGVAHAQGLAANDRGANGIFSFALADGRLVAKALLPAASDLRIIGDVGESRDGVVYAPDSVAPVIYTLDETGQHLSPWLSNENFSSLQGVTTTPDDSHLIVADYDMGLHVIDRATKNVETIAFADGTTLLGIDGLYRFENTLFAVQNGTKPQRLIALSLGPANTIAHVRVLSANDAKIPEPSLGAIVDGKFCVVANAQWSRFKDDGTRAVPLDPVRIACVRLPETR